MAGQGGAQPPHLPADVERVKLWDPVLRSFHWLLAGLVVTSWLLGKFGPNVMTLHFWSGYAIIGLLAFRLVWGLIGPPPARFTHFLAGPASVIGYMRHLFDRRPSYWPGHNPMGAWSVVILLGLLAYQIGTGLVMDPDDYINVGPLASEVSAATRKAARGWHHTGAALILVMAALRVGVTSFYPFWKREDLVRPMLPGWKGVRRP